MAEFKSANLRRSEQIEERSEYIAMNGREEVWRGSILASCYPTM